MENINQEKNNNMVYGDPNIAIYEGSPINQEAILEPIKTIIQEPVQEPEIINKIHITCSANILKKIINLQKTTMGKNFDEDGKIVFYMDHISLKNVDPAHVCMIMQDIQIENFLEYRYENNTRDQEKNFIELGFNYSRLVDILKNTTKNDTITIDYDINMDHDIINIKIGFFTYKLCLIDINGIPDPKIPILNFNSSFIINTKTFLDFLNNANKIVDCMYIKTDNNYLTLYANNDIDNMRLEIPINDLKMFKTNGNIKSCYSIDYLLNIFKPLKTMYNDVKINLNNDYPLEIISNDGTYTRILLAPRIESE